MSKEWALQGFEYRKWWTIHSASEAEIKAMFQGLIFRPGIYRVMNPAGLEISRVMAIEEGDK